MIERIPVKIEKLREDIIIPQKASVQAAAYDIYSPTHIKWILPGEVHKLDLGFKLEIPEGYKVEIYSRSGLASKGLMVANQPGKVDSDYRGEVCVLLYNFSKWRHFEINVGDRIAQLEIAPIYDIDFEQVTTINQTDRGEGGFGSTGK